MRLFRRPAPLPAAPSLDFAAMETAIRARLDLALTSSGVLCCRPRRMGSYRIATSSSGTLDREIKRYLVEVGKSGEFSATLLRDFKHWLSLSCEVLHPQTVIKAEGVRTVSEETSQ